MALPTNIQSGWKSLPWTNTLAYLPGESEPIFEKKFYKIDARLNSKHTSTASKNRINRFKTGFLQESAGIS
jgi:hypothetical protein